jgi:uncharacterized membrane protein
MAWTELVSFGWWAMAVRWLHVMAGIMWIGHLWYLNFTQTPTLPKIPQEYRPGVVRYVFREALFWLRWGAAATVVTGLVLAWFMGELPDALKLGIGDHNSHLTAIGLGIWLAILMAANVWIVIWPNQRKSMGLVPAKADARARATRIAGLATRINLMLSIPMLYGMTSVHFY